SSNSKTGSRSRGLRSVTGCPQYAAGRRLHGERRQRGNVLILAVRRRAQFEGLRALALVRCARATRARAKKQAEESRPPPQRLPGVTQRTRFRRQVPYSFYSFYSFYSLCASDFPGTVRRRYQRAGGGISAHAVGSRVQFPVIFT